MTVNQTIKFSDIPKTTQLYKDFLYNFQRVSRFYQPEGLDIAALTSRAAKVTAQTFSRDAVADVLADQNRNAGAGEATFANIERLRQTDSVVVITGQQAGLFTGPLYTIFKALTAIRLAEHLRTQGVNAFYDSVELRKACCHARKVEPLGRALAGKQAWITGLRAQQSTTRTDLPKRQFDEGNGLVKFNPLSDWSEKEVWAYIRIHQVPYNALHDKFYPSIGCAPCTRPISLGEDIRAGRWWWENPETKECGLHVKKI